MQEAEIEETCVEDLLGDIVKNCEIS